MTAARRPKLALSIRRRMTQIFGKLALSLSSVVFALFAMEVALRVLQAQPKSTGSSALSCFFAPDAHLGWRGQENAAYQLTTDSFDAFVSHDADGLRRCGLSTRIQDDADYPGEVIWCIGDSTTYGWGIEDGKTFVDLLNQTSSGDRIYRNLGVPGYSPQQELLLLRQFLRKGHRPDRILILFCPNDLGDNLNPSMPGPSLAIVSGEVVERACPPIETHGWSQRVWLKDSLLTYNYLSFYTKRAKQTLRGWLHGSRDSWHPPTASAVPGQTSEQLLAMRSVYGSIASLCREHGVKLMVATPVTNELLERVCAELSLPLLELASHFVDRGVGSCSASEVTFANDPHWNELGNQIVAEAIVAGMQRLPETRVTTARTPRTNGLDR